MNTQRNRSKAKRFWPYGSETRADALARIHATKKNSKKKRLRAKYAKPKDAPDLKAERVTQAREAARRVFERWLLSPNVTKIAAELVPPRDSSRLVRLVREILRDATEE